MTKIRKYIYLEDKSDEELSWELLDNITNTNHLNGRGEAFQKIYNDYLNLQSATSTQDSLAKKIAQEIKPQLDPIRIRTGYVDKNLRVIIELLNSWIIVNGLDDKFPLTDLKSQPIEDAWLKISSEIKGYQEAQKDRAEKKAGLENE